MNKKLNFPERKVIQTKSTLAIDDKKFFLEIQEAILDGYRICENTKMTDSCSRNLFGFMGQCVLYPDGREYIEDPEISVLNKETGDGSSGETSCKNPSLDELNSKVDLIKFADDNGLCIPEDKKQPAAIKKWIKSQLEKGS